MLFCRSGCLHEKNFTVDHLLSIAAAVMSATIVFASESLSGLVTMVFITALLLALVIEGKGKKAVSFIIILGLTALSWTILSLHKASFITELRDSTGLLLATAGVAILLFLGYLLAKHWQKINKKKMMISGAIVIILIIAVSVPLIPKVESAVTAELNRINSDLIKNA